MDSSAFNLFFGVFGLFLVLVLLCFGVPLPEGSLPPCFWLCCAGSVWFLVPLPLWFTSEVLWFCKITCLSPPWVSGCICDGPGVRLGVWSGCVPCSSLHSASWQQRLRPCVGLRPLHHAALRVAYHHNRTASGQDSACHPILDHTSHRADRIKSFTAQLHDHGSTFPGHTAAANDNLHAGLLSSYAQPQ